MDSSLVRFPLDWQHSNNACNIQLMVHYHQQALQYIMLADIFEVCCITVAITKPVCKNIYAIIHRNQWTISHVKDVFLFFFLYHFPVFCFFLQDRDCNGINLMQFLKKGVSMMDVHHNLPKKPTSFSSDFALALSICLCFYFCNICIYCCLMSHTSMITSEISHRFGRVQLMKSSIVLFFHVQFFFLLDLALPFYTQNTRGVLIQCLHSDQQCSDQLS